jgi:hypothetical protein
VKNTSTHAQSVMMHTRTERDRSNPMCSPFCQSAHPNEFLRTYVGSAAGLLGCGSIDPTVCQVRAQPELAGVGVLCCASFSSVSLLVSVDLNLPHAFVRIRASIGRKKERNRIVANIGHVANTNCFVRHLVQQLFNLMSTKFKPV